jgi:hypothetical protein
MNMSIVKVDGSEWISASSLLHGTPSRTYRRGRICASSGCGTLLSRYNPTSRCSLHNELH